MTDKPTIYSGFFQPLVEALGRAVAVLDGSFGIIAFNEPFARHIRIKTGIDVNVHQKLFDRFEADKHRWKKLLDEVMNGKTCEDVLENDRSGDTVKLSLLRDEAGNKAILVELKEASLETSSYPDLSTFRLLANNLPDMDVFLCDARMNILIAGGGEMLKYGNDSVFFEGRNMIDLAREFGLDFLVPLYRDGVKGWTSEIEYGYNDNYYRVQICPLMQDGKVKNVIVVSSNVSELKSANVKLQQLNESKDNILGIVAHDLRNPITAILGVVELAKSGEITFESKQEIIERSGHSALSIISDLLDISELGKENFVLQTQRTSLNRFLESLVMSNRVLAESKQITLEIEKPAGEIGVNINPDKFARVMNNLVTNAIKFSHPNSRVLISLEQERQQVIIRVKDHGIGIPSDLQAYLFDKFTRAGRKGTAGEKSIGLGMSIVKQIVRLHGGEIWIESEEGKGTTVNIRLFMAS